MADKTTLLRAFNNHFFEFIDDIIHIFPNKHELNVSKTSFETIKKANPTAIIKAWKIYVYDPYSDAIEKGDITFFFEKDYSSDLQGMHNAKNIMQTIDTFREPVKEMGESNKQHTMKYIKNLSKLANMYSDL